jgi:two-component system chemotaxis response regulator CheB
MPTNRTRVLIVDDSALVRQMLTAILSDDPTIEVVGAASDPYVARDLIKSLNPDVVTLDIEMPRMDGLEFLEKIMTLRPMPVLMISSLTQKGADTAIRALELGAVDFIAKVKAAATARIRPRTAAHGQPRPVAASPGMGYVSTNKIVAIGASTGGVEALTAVLTTLPADAPGILITQHMPAHFTDSFARRLNSISAINISEAADGTRVLPGHAYIAPGGRHLRLARSGGNFICRVGGTERVSGHCPSVDVLFASVAEVAAQNAIGVILTGMGKDGAMGLMAMRKAGARTLGQTEASCVVYGMPRIAFEVGAVEAQIAIDSIARRILDLCGDRRTLTSGARAG